MCPTAETAQRMLHKEKSSRGVKSLQQHGDGKGSEGCPTSVRGQLCPSVSPSQVFGWQLRSHRDSRGWRVSPETSGGQDYFQRLNTLIPCPSLLLC